MSPTRPRSRVHGIVLILLMGFFLVSASQAVLRIEISGGVEGALPIAILPFKARAERPAADSPSKTEIARIIRADLARSGRFEVIPSEQWPSRPDMDAQVDFAKWRQAGIESLVIGQLRPAAEGPGYRIRYRLLDTFSRSELEAFELTVPAEQFRQAAHRISDRVYETLIGEPGAFNTRIAYVKVVQQSEGTRRFTLSVADSDGHNPRPVLESNHPILSPAWSPDGKRLAYVSYENRRPEVFVHTLASGKRRAVAAHPGINGAPAWSPDGERLALVLSKDGSPDIYLLDLETDRLQRLTDARTIETEPAWHPEGEHLYFTSDRSGQPQIYRIPRRGGAVERITFTGGYNVSPDISTRNEMALVRGEGDRFRILIHDLDTRLTRVISQGTLEESPSFAPNGRMLIYAGQAAEDGVLFVASADGRARHRLVLDAGSVREPAWSPYPANGKP